MPQDPGLPLQLMPDKAILYYTCSWSHGSLQMYSLFGGLVPGRSVDIVLPMGLQTPFFPLVLPPIPSLGPRICIDQLLQTLLVDSYTKLLSENASWHQQ